MGGARSPATRARARRSSPRCHSRCRVPPMSDMALEPEDGVLGQEQAPRRVIIADDHELARLGLRTMLAPEPDLEVVGEAATGREAVELSRRLEPDLVLMEIRMPELDGLAATRAIQEALPRTSILIVTLSEDPDYLMEALRVGAAGFVL